MGCVVDISLRYKDLKFRTPSSKTDILYVLFYYEGKFWDTKLLLDIYTHSKFVKNCNRCQFDNPPHKVLYVVYYIPKQTMMDNEKKHKSIITMIS